MRPRPTKSASATRRIVFRSADRPAHISRQGRRDSCRENKTVPIPRQAPARRSGARAEKQKQEEGG